VDDGDFLVKKLVRKFGNGRRRSQHSDIRIFFLRTRRGGTIIVGDRMGKGNGVVDVVFDGVFRNL
jgi:hypothetical protein